MDKKAVIYKKFGSKAIAIDEDTFPSLMQLLAKGDKYTKKFTYVTELILNGQATTEHYKRENINDLCKDITAIRLFTGGENIRLYCKEVKTEEYTVVVVVAKVLEKKKSKKNDKTINSLLESIAKRVYEIKELNENDEGAE